MACSFAYLEDSCGCLIGYQLPLKTVDNIDINSYPVDVLNVDEVNLGEAASPSAYVALWNSNVANQAVGILTVGTGAYCFNLSYIKDAAYPSRLLGLSGTPPSLTGDFDYGATEADTTGDALTEAQYRSAVDDVYTASDEVPGVAVAPGANIQVNDFGNATDKVLFMLVYDDAEAAFTKWSVVGDPLQQNQPIDATFGTGSNVWFKSTMASANPALNGRNVYITRGQTSFAGAVIFSR